MADTVVESLDRDLERLRERAPDVADSVLAAAARVLAAQLDDVRTSATSKSMCARALTETMERLLALAPDEKEETELDRVRARRAAARSGGAAA